jgi:hypothetical protein
MKSKDMLRYITISCAFLLILGCASIDGDYNENQRPQVSFVNNNADGDSIEIYEDIEYTFVFVDSLVGFEENDIPAFPTEIGVETRFELISYQYFKLTSISAITETINIYDPVTFELIGTETNDVPEENYNLDTNLGRYLLITQTYDTLTQTGYQWKRSNDVTYSITGEFRYQPIFSYSPMIFWRGSDGDGFVESYRYLDFTYTNDEDFVALKAVIDNEINTPDSLSSLEWLRTLNTQAVINLRTELGQVQRHVVVLQAIDNDGVLSQPKYRNFYRSNRAPNSPMLSFKKEGFSKVGEPTEYQRHIITWKDMYVETDDQQGPWIDELMLNTQVHLELPMSEVQLENWSGVRFIATASDPDDEAGLTVPLQFQYKLNRIPDELVEQLMDTTQTASNDTDLWYEIYPDSEVSVDSLVLSNYEEYNFSTDNWTDLTEVTLYNLRSGFYQITVYSRDDGLEQCAEPAWMRFNVQESTMEKDILLINFTVDGVGSYPLPMPLDSLKSFYMNTIEDVLPMVTNEEVVWYSNPDDDNYNCRYWAEGNSEDYPYSLPYSVVNQYKTVICVYDNWVNGSGFSALRPNSLLSAYRGLFIDYLDMGGSLFWTGYSNFGAAFGYNNGVNTGSSVDDQPGDLVGDYLGIGVCLIDVGNDFLFSRGDGLVAANSTNEYLADMNVGNFAMMRDISNNIETPFTLGNFYGLPDSSLIFLESFSLSSGETEALYTYDSYSEDIEAEGSFSTFRVVLNETQLPEEFHGDGTHVAPTATSCWIRVNSFILDTLARATRNMDVIDVTRVLNLNKFDSDGDPLWGNPYPPVRGLAGDSQNDDDVFIYINHQTIEDPAMFWGAGDTIYVELTWNPILVKHNRPIVCYTENISYATSFGGIGFGPLWTNYRTAFSGLPLFLMDEGSTEFDENYLFGTGSKGLLHMILQRFYATKVQDMVEF